MVKNTKITKPQRNFGVTLVSGIFALFAFMLAFGTYNATLTSIGTSIFLGLMGIVFVAIAAYGRLEPLRQFAKAIFDIRV